MNDLSVTAQSARPMNEIQAEYSMLSKIFKQLSKLEDALVILKRQNEICTQLDQWTHRTQLALRTSTNPSEHLDMLIEWSPQFLLWHRRFFKSVLNSPLCSDIEKHLGLECIESWRQHLKIVNKEVIDKLREEIKLGAEYDRLIGGANVDFRDKTLPLKSLLRHLHSSNRNTRKSAMIAYWSWFEDNGMEIDEIFQSLVKLRCDTAKQLGWKNVSEFMYARYGRTQYTPTEIGRFRNSLRELLVPILNDITFRQEQALSIDASMPWDENVFNHQGNPRPISSKNWLWERVKEVLPKASPRFERLFTSKNNLFIHPQPSSSQESLAFFEPEKLHLWLQTDGTMSDITQVISLLTDALIQRSALQSPYSIQPNLDRKLLLKKIFVGLCLPHMEYLFPDNAEQYRSTYSLLELRSLNQLLMQDHFQQLIYSKPEASLFERNAMWNRVETLYQPKLNWGDIAHPARGAAWHAVPSIFTQPFSGIGKALAIPYGLQFILFQQENPLRAQTRAEYLFDESFGPKPTESLSAVKCISPLKLEMIEHVLGDIKRRAFSSML